MLSSDENLKLSQMINESGCGDNTDTIRALKHSVMIRDEIRKMESFKITHLSLKASEPELYLDNARRECFFLYQHYTDIFQRILDDKLDLVIMSRVLTILKMIEDNTIDQHEGSVLVGKLLKEMYIDSAIQMKDAAERSGGGGDDNSENQSPSPHLSVSWNEFKQLQRNNGDLPLPPPLLPAVQVQVQVQEEADDDEDYTDMPDLISIDSI